MSERVFPSLLFDVPHDTYHADDFGDQPTLSRSVAYLLVKKSPLHAWDAHPRLGGMLHRERPNEPRDNGTLMHLLLFGGGPEVVPVEAKDWRTKAAQEARDEACERGALPVLVRVLEEAASVAEIYRQRLLDVGVNPLACGREAVALWDDGGVRCRARFDLVYQPDGVVWDAKFLRNGRPADFDRAMVLDGYDIQAAAYLRALQAVCPEADRPRIEYLLCETEKPYAVAAVPVGESMRSLGEQKWSRAVRLWRECLDSGKWPGYGRREAVAPAWALSEEFDAQVQSVPEPEWARGE